MTREVVRLIYYAVAAVSGLAALIYLLFWNWPVALAIFVMLWANNIGTRKD